MNFPIIEATAVVRENSLAFVEEVLALNAVRRPLVMVANEEAAGTIAGVEIDRCIVPAEQSGWYLAKHPLIYDDLPAQISYTSGTEGQPKGILLTYANLADAATRIIEEMQLTADIREYVGVPATFSFGMARYRVISAVGGQAYLPPRGFDPLEFARMLAAGQVNALSAVPTLLRVLLDASGTIRDAGKRLRWMEIGSQHMTAAEKLRIRALFPNAIIVQHYGLTEASRSTFLRISHAQDDLLESVGRPVGRTEVQIGPDNRIRVRGPHVARSEVNATGRHDLLDAEGWLQTNDLGHMKGGYLFFDGRADDLINFGGIKISPDELEERIRSRVGRRAQIAVAKVPDLQRGDGILIALQSGTSDAERVKKAATAALHGMGIAAGNALHLMTVDTMPLTGTGKVQRRVLADQFLSQQGSDHDRTNGATAQINDVRSLFQHEFFGQVVKPEDSFETLGGDSLLYIQFSLSFEQRFGQLPDNWERLSVAELQQRVGEVRKSTWRRLESTTFLRAFFMVCIVALHANAFVYSSNWGAAYFLILLAGYSVARFQLPEIIRTGSTRTLWGTIKYAALPTILTVAFLQVATQRFEVLPLLLVSNFIDPHSLKGFLLYFVEFYLQLLALTAVFFSFSKVRRWFELRPMLSALALLLMAAGLNQIITSVWDGDYNYNRNPWHYGWIFALGFVLASAREPRTRILALMVSLVAVLLKWGMTSAGFYVAGGCAIVLFVQSVSVPASVKVFVAEIAGASLFIYLTHYVTISVVRKIFGEERPWVALLSSIIVGVVMAHLYTWALRKFTQRVYHFRHDGQTTALP